MTSSESVRLLLLTPLLTGLALASVTTFPGLAVATFTGRNSSFCSGATFSVPGTCGGIVPRNDKRGEPIARDGTGVTPVSG